LKAASQEVASYGYAGMVLDRVASEAGYTRGALYHQFASKEDLVLAVVEWVREAWSEEVGFLLTDETDPVGTLIAVARAYAVYSRHEPARALARLSAEFAGADHPVEKAINRITGDFCEVVVRFIEAGRTTGAIPSGPPARVTAIAYMGAMDGLVNDLGDQAPFDALFAEKSTLGVLGLRPKSETGDS
jgi:AcrR family transcriptional regulator